MPGRHRFEFCPLPCISDRPSGRCHYTAGIEGEDVAAVHELHPSRCSPDSCMSRVHRRRILGMSHKSSYRSSAKLWFDGLTRLLRSKEVSADPTRKTHTGTAPRVASGVDVCASSVCTAFANARRVKRRSGRNRFVFDDGIAATKTERPRKPESPRSPPRELLPATLRCI